MHRISIKIRNQLMKIIIRKFYLTFSNYFLLLVSVQKQRTKHRPISFIELITIISNELSWTMNPVIEQSFGMIRNHQFQQELSEKKGKTTLSRAEQHQELSYLVWKISVQHATWTQFFNVYWISIHFDTISC